MNVSTAHIERRFLRAADVGLCTFTSPRDDTDDDDGCLSGAWTVRQDAFEHHHLSSPDGVAGHQTVETLVLLQQHGDAYVATRAAESFLPLLRTSWTSFDGTVPGPAADRIIKDAFLSMDGQLREHPGAYLSGCTAFLAVLVGFRGRLHSGRCSTAGVPCRSGATSGDTEGSDDPFPTEANEGGEDPCRDVSYTDIYCCNLGDSHAYLSNGKTYTAMGESHSPNDPNELARVLDFGLRRELCLRMPFTRAFGMFLLKGQTEGADDQGLTCRPSVHTTRFVHGDVLSIVMARGDLKHDARRSAIIARGDVDLQTDLLSDVDLGFVAHRLCMDAASSIRAHSCTSIVFTKPRDPSGDGGAPLRQWRASSVLTSSIGGRSALGPGTDGYTPSREAARSPRQDRPSQKKRRH